MSSLFTFYKTSMSSCFDQECKKTKKKGGKRVFSLVFLDPSSPRLASSSPGLPNNFMMKKPTRLGELQLPQSDPLPINRHTRGVLKGPRFRSWGNWEKKEKRRRKKRKGGRGTTESQPRSSLTSFLVLCSSSDHRLVFFLRIECDLCTLRGHPYYYMHIHLLHCRNQPFGRGAKRPISWAKSICLRGRKWAESPPTFIPGKR